ncbi:MAG: polyphenol oxidase family protein [Actinomycetota bacterium]|nr:polyphenol oxidase family protein [Actinomycetota bacterium]MDQ3681013.1 polyphenol oxidase family protein [Actinomycetota bacterium]
MRWTGRAEGDALERREGPPRGWEGVVELPITWLRQVHGDRVVVVDHPLRGPAEEGDALVTARTDLALGVLTADCAPVALASAEGVVGAAHAGWAGLARGVIERTVETMRALGASRIEAALGPCIRAECYQFAAADLERLTARLGKSILGATRAGAPALDLPAGVAAALRRAGADIVHDEGQCTACSSGSPLSHPYFSHRARGETERQAMVVWRA